MAKLRSHSRRPPFGHQTIADSYRDLCRLIGVDDLSGSGTYRISHSACSDARKRLYFTAGYEDGRAIIKGYCHNCSIGGVYAPSGPHRTFYEIRDIIASEETVERGPPGLPADLAAISEAPVAAQAYFSKYGVDPGVLLAGWSPSLGRIIIPIYDMSPGDADSRYLGYIGRAVPGAGNGIAKYVSAAGPEPLATWYRVRPTVGSSCIVFTEDVVSAAVVATAYPGAVGVPLFGLNIRPEEVLRRMKQFPDLIPVVWLDNDPPSVTPRERLTAILRAFGHRPFVVDEGPEPKKRGVGTVGGIISDIVAAR